MESETEIERKIDFLMTASYICVTYSHSFRGYERLFVDLQRLIKGLNLAKTIGGSLMCC